MLLNGSVEIGICYLAYDIVKLLICALLHFEVSKTNLNALQTKFTTVESPLTR